MTIQVNSGLYITSQDYLGQLRTTVESIRAFLDCSERFRIIQDDTRPLWTQHDHLEPFRTLCDPIRNTQDPMTPRGQLGLFRTALDTLGPLKANQDCS